MTLSDVQALDLLTTPKNQAARQEALRWQNRVRFHGLTIRDKAASAHWRHFRQWVFSFVLVDDKRALFDRIFPFPVPTTRMLAQVHDNWMKLFDAVNPELRIEASEGIESDYLAYLDQIGEPDFWPDESVSALFESNNDLLLIDLKPDATTGRPAPYLSRLSLDSVISLELNDDATATHVAYKAADSSVVVVDDTSYRVYTQVDGNWTLQDPVYTHGLKRCPCRLLWDERVANHAVASSAPVDEVLSELDSYAFWHVAYDMFKLYGAFPIYYGMEQSEGDAKPPAPLARNADGTVDAGFADSCYPQPAAGSSFVAPGEYWELKFGADMKTPPVGIVEVSTDALNFHAEDRERLYNKLVSYLVGEGGESQNMADDAMNEKQITGNFSSKENVLRYLSRHLSAARQWVLMTMGELRYGSAIKSVSFTFGTEFYLQTETELWNGLIAARTAGSPQSILAEKVRGIQSFRLRSGGNPTRSQIMLDLEPLPEQSLLDVQAMAISGLIPLEKAAVKANFTDLIAQFEREVGTDLVTAGSLLSYPEKINRITQFLYSHVNPKRPEQPALSGPDESKPVGSTADASA